MDLAVEVVVEVDDHLLHGNDLSRLEVAGGGQLTTFTDPLVFGEEVRYQRVRHAHRCLLQQTAQPAGAFRV